MKTLQREINDLLDAQGIKNNEVFQKHFVKPMQDELNSMKYAYSCDTIKELQKLKGKRQGLQFFLKLLKKIDEDIKIKRDQLSSDTEEK